MQADEVNAMKFTADMTTVASHLTAVSDDNGVARILPIDDPDLDLAEKIQQLLLPKSSPSCTWCCIGVKNRMAARLGGDYFDFITMPDECQSLFIGDVTRHG